MPQTANFGFPLWGDTPPEGATGKDLRDAILGEGRDSLASMVDMELENVKRTVPPVGKNTFNVEWDGSTAGRVKAIGSYKYSMKFGTTLMGDIALQYYKVYDEPVISRSALTGSGKAYVTYNKVQFSLDFGFKITGEREFSKASDNVYICLTNGTSPVTSEGSILALFSVLEDGAVYSSEDGTLTFPEKGLYAVKAQGYDARFVSLSSEENAYYDPDTMPDAAMELISHKVTEISEESTDKQYPSAKAVWNALNSNSGSGGISEIKVNGEAAVPEDGSVDITVPTKVSELENDEGYLTEDDISIPTKLSELINDTGFVTADPGNLNDTENTSNKVTYFNSAENLNDIKYPTTQAVYDFVKEELETAPAKVFLPFAEWDGDTDGRDNFLGIFYKISDATDVPNYPLMVERSFRDADGTTSLFFKYVTDGSITVLEDAFGIVILTVEETPAVVIADRSGTLPAAVIEEMMGENPGMDVPYTQGTYFLYVADDGGSVFDSKAEIVMTAKEYIDRKFDELAAMMTGGGE